MKDIERLAREAGLNNNGSWWFDADSNAQSDVSTAALARFAALVRADERERCTKVVADLALRRDADDPHRRTLEWAAAAIAAHPPASPEVAK